MTKPKKDKWTDKNGKPTYSRDERVIWDSKNLTFAEKGFYAGLKSFRNDQSKQTFPSIRTICDKLGICSDTAYKCRKTLQNIGVLDVVTHRGRKKSCRYRFILEDGNSQEISNAFDNLLGNKIADNIGKGNSRQNHEQNSRLNRIKIADNKVSNNKKVTRRKEPHTEQTPCQEENPFSPTTTPAGVCDKNPLKEKATDHMVNLPDDVQEIIRLYKTLNPKEDIQNLAGKARRAEWEPPSEITDLAEYIKLSIQGDKVFSPIGLKTSIIQQFKAGTLDPVEGLKTLKGADDVDWLVPKAKVFIDSYGESYTLSKVKAEWKGECDKGYTSLNFDDWMEHAHPDPEKGTCFLDHDGNKIKYSEAFTIWSRIDCDNSNGGEKLEFYKWVDEIYASGMVNGKKMSASKVI
jgi:hypothetical protein